MAEWKPNLGGNEDHNMNAAFPISRRISDYSTVSCFQTVNNIGTATLAVDWYRRLVPFLRLLTGTKCLRLVSASNSRYQITVI